MRTNANAAVARNGAAVSSALPHAGSACTNAIAVRNKSSASTSSLCNVSTIAIFATDLIAFDRINHKALKRFDQFGDQFHESPFANYFRRRGHDEVRLVAKRIAEFNEMSRASPARRGEHASDSAWHQRSGLWPWGVPSLVSFLPL